MGRLLIIPDDFVHDWVGKERLVQLVMAPLPVAQQVKNHILAELALVFKSQPCGTHHFLWAVSIDMDDGTAHKLPWSKQDRDEADQLPQKNISISPSPAVCTGRGPRSSGEVCHGY